jgi:energy-converting hydrogenase Eha subunit A
MLFMEKTTIALLILVPLLVWRIYSRVKKLMQRQESHLWRHWAAAILFPLAIIAAGTGAVTDQLALACLAAGTLAGAWAGVWGVKLTRFEYTGKSFFYTPNLHMGIAVTMLFTARIIYRGLELYMNSREAMPAPMPKPSHDFTQSPLTMLTFGLLAAYYASYAVGLLRWRRNQKPLAVVE